MTYTVLYFPDAGSGPFMEGRTDDRNVAKRLFAEACRRYGCTVGDDCTRLNPNNTRSVELICPTIRNISQSLL